MEDPQPERPRDATVAATDSDGRGDDTDPGGGQRAEVGVLVADSPRAEADRLAAFARRMASDAADELAAATDLPWRFTETEPTPLSDTQPRRPSQFLDEAMDRMVAGPYDLVVVVTDVPLVSRRRRFVAGLASPVSRVVVVSTRRLSAASRGTPARALDSEAVRWNAATLLLHLLGHVLGARHEADGETVMAPFEFDPSRESTPTFAADVERHLGRVAGRIPDEAAARGSVRRFAFHVLSALRNPEQVVGALAGSRPLGLPLSLPKLATGAVAPALVIVFSAESWDVGLHLTNGTAALFAAASVLAAAVHLLFVHSLSFPRRSRQPTTEHMALVNVTVFLVLVGAMVGLFALVASVVLAIEFLVFPPQLMADWPSLENPAVDLVDRVRTAGFISTVGMLSGALAGGLESRDVLRHLALFRERP